VKIWVSDKRGKEEKKSKRKRQRGWRSLGLVSAETKVGKSERKKFLTASSTGCKCEYEECPR